jgi:alpha-ketoglutarate-dependent 2,4-dichlorophenoxyacetate dioxygenase
MSLHVEPAQKNFVAELRGINISEPLPPDVVRAVHEAIDRYGVVVFRSQKLDDEQQMRFAEQFGPLERYSLSYRADRKLRLAHREMVDVSNIDAHTGNIQDKSARHRMINLGNRMWHTDSSFRIPSGALSMLYAHVVPRNGGDTEFSDMRSAYAALPEARKKAIVGLKAEHWLMHSRAVLGFTDFTEEERAALPPVTQDIVRTHPRSGNKALYLGSHASHIIGLPVPEGRVMLMELTEFATQRQFVYTHHWEVGDLVIWDNRVTVHRALPFDETEVRDLRRVTTSDVEPLAQAAE